MISISMPVVAGSETVESALGQMAERDRIAVVVRNVDGLEIVWGDQLRSAAGSGTGLVGSVSGEPVQLVTPMDFARHGIRSFQIASLPDSFYEAIRAEIPSTADFAAIDASPMTALIVPRTIQLVEYLRGAPHYKCDGPRIHRFGQSPPYVGNPCPYALCPGTIVYAS
jgi:hypothetical protein